MNKVQRMSDLVTLLQLRIEDGKSQAQALRALANALDRDENRHAHLAQVMFFYEPLELEDDEMIGEQLVMHAFIQE